MLCMNYFFMLSRSVVVMIYIYIEINSQLFRIII